MNRMNSVIAKPETCRLLTPDGRVEQYDFATNIISPIPSRVLVIRTGDGKYGKVQIVSYYLEAPSSPAPMDKPRFCAFRYVYQPDGSMRVRWGEKQEDGQR
jgi:hypothetical protein